MQVLHEFSELQVKQRLLHLTHDPSWLKKPGLQAQVDETKDELGLHVLHLLASQLGHNSKH